MAAAASGSRGWRGRLVPLAGAGILIALMAYLLRPAPTLEGIDRLMARQQYEPAERMLRNYLRANPDDPRACFLLAQVAVERPDPKDPRLALVHLKRIRSPDKRTRALVRVMEGKAYYLLNRFIDAEASWKEALAIDPLVPEAGWGLMSVYSLQNRAEEGRRLALELEAREPSAHDRVQFLLQMIRYDVHALAPGSTVEQLERVVKTDPRDMHTTLALGWGLVRDGRRLGEGLAYLKGATEAHPDDVHVWEVYLAGLETAGQIGEMDEILERLPARLARDPRLAEARGRVAYDRKRWKEAIVAYREARERHPGSKEVLYRLVQSLERAGQGDEAARLRPRVARIEDARVQLRTLYDKADGTKSLGDVPDYPLYQGLADALEALNRFEEARAWHDLVLRDRPGDPISKPAAERLATEARGETHL
jgi:tetratricopeptide (TPR) repeat protein